MGQQVSKEADTLQCGMKTFGLGEEVERNSVAACRGDLLCWAAHRLRVQSLHAC